MPYTSNNIEKQIRFDQFCNVCILDLIKFLNE